MPRPVPRPLPRAEDRAVPRAEDRVRERTEARPELTRLDEDQRGRALRKLRRKGAACPRCGSRRLRVGDALYLGFLFLDEEVDAYMIAVTCARRRCPQPRTGIVLRAGEFLTR